MSHSPNPAKIEQWTERIERFDIRAQTVAQFCAEEGVSTPSFYRWKKRLGVNIRGQIASPGRPNSKPAFRPLELISAPVNPFQQTTIRLADGVVIELGNDFPVVDQVLRAIVHPSLRNGTAQPEGPSC
jgi:hypothetical protein